MSHKANPQISFDYCIKCTICNTVCPVSWVYPPFPGPKYLGPDSERFRLQERFDVEQISSYCMNCKRCEYICPSDVQITHFIEQDKFKQKKNLIKFLRSQFFIYMDFVGHLAVFFSPVVNFVLSLHLTRWLMDMGLGIAKKRRLPKYNAKTFKSILLKRIESKKVSKRNIVKETENPPQPPGGTKKKSNLQLHFFYGCYINYNDSSLGSLFLDFCQRNEIDLVHLSQKCCGIPIASNGDSRAYQKRIRENFSYLWPVIQNGGKIVVLSSSCHMALCHDYCHYLELDEKQKIQYRNGILFFHDLLELCSNHSITLNYRKIKRQIVYHVPCHVKFIGGQAETVAYLQKFTDDLVVLDDHCCGIAGSYGLKKEFHNISQKVGALLFEKMRFYPEALFVSECETCRMQIEENTQHKVLHPLALLLDS